MGKKRSTEVHEQEEGSDKAFLGSNSGSYVDPEVSVRKERSWERRKVAKGFERVELNDKMSKSSDYGKDADPKEDTGEKTWQIERNRASLGLRRWADKSERERDG